MNAKQELIDILEGDEIKCALIKFGTYDNYKSFPLKTNTDIKGKKEWLDSSDFEYNSITEFLFGTIWLDNGSILHREPTQAFFGFSWTNTSLLIIPDELKKE